MKGRYWPVFVVLLLLGWLSSAACGGGNGAGSAQPAAEEPAVFEITPELVAFGAETYARNCAPCHGPNGKGDGPSAATLNPKPRDHTNTEYMQTLSDKKIADTIKMGGIVSGYPNMPSNPALSRDQIVALVAFVRRLSAPDAPSVDLTGF